MKTVQFYTQINTSNGFRGAQRKTKDIFSFINTHRNFKAIISFHQPSQWSPDVPWPKNLVLSHDKINTNSDFFFLKHGKDWINFRKKYPKLISPAILSPVVNYRVLDEKHKSHILLKEKAIRVCPNPDLTKKIKASANGDTYTINHGVDTTFCNKTEFASRDIDILIVALKNPTLGQELYCSLVNSTKKNVFLLSSYISHDMFLELLANSKITIHLPQKTESYYLPGLEGMQLGTITVMPNCTGNLYYSINNINCFITRYDYQDLLKQTLELLNLNTLKLQELSAKSSLYGNKFNLKYERRLWHELLNKI